MAWHTQSGTHQYRKEAARSLRSGENRVALVDPDRRGKRKRIRNDARKFGLEFKTKDGHEFIGFQRSHYQEWQRYCTKYETAKQRNQALETMNRNDRFFQYRAVNF